MFSTSYLLLLLILINSYTLPIMNCVSLSEVIIIAFTFCLLSGYSMSSPVHHRSGSPRASSSSSNTDKQDSDVSPTRKSKSQSPGRNRPKWVDPCGLATHFTYFDPVSTFVGVSHNVPTTKLLNAVVSPTRKAKQHAERVKHQFVSYFFVFLLFMSILRSSVLTGDYQELIS